MLWLCEISWHMHVFIQHFLSVYLSETMIGAGDIYRLLRYGPNLTEFIAQGERILKFDIMKKGYAATMY